MILRSGRVLHDNGRKRPAWSGWRFWILFGDEVEVVHDTMMKIKYPSACGFDKELSWKRQTEHQEVLHPDLIDTFPK